MIDRPSFIGESEWAGLSETARKYWRRWNDELDSLMKLPSFRSFAITFVDHPSLCGVGASIFSANGQAMARDEGKRIAGILLRNEMQRVSPEMYRRAWNEGLNNALDFDRQLDAELQGET